ncbi:hypothetical protein ACFPYI_14130 [Halomarina salina]|uniref:Uncharacterized protein n=1 Tax=Halomarina salina TaxID=1872699 RepID=A0ABD5RQC9_9EURY|nr:hypothetical protein [Halomarina salina]
MGNQSWSQQHPLALAGIFIAVAALLFAVGAHPRHWWLPTSMALTICIALLARNMAGLGETNSGSFEGRVQGLALTVFSVCMLIEGVLWPVPMLRPFSGDYSGGARVLALILWGFVVLLFVIGVSNFTGLNQSGAGDSTAPDSEL